MLAVRWYQRFGLSYRDVEDLISQRRLGVDHVTIFWWIQALHSAPDRVGSSAARRWKKWRRQGSAVVGPFAE
jgi:transposase-like protein